MLNTVHSYTSSGEVKSDCVSLIRRGCAGGKTSDRLQDGRAGRALAPGHRSAERHLVWHAGPLIRAQGDPGRVTTASVKNGSSMAGAAFRRMVGTCVLVSPDRPCLMLRTAAMARSTCLRPTGPARVLEVNDGAATVSTGWVSRGPVNHLERERAAPFKQFECVRSGFAAAVRRRRGCSAARPGTAPCTARSA